VSIVLVMRLVDAYHLCSEHAAAILVLQTFVVVLVFTNVRMNKPKISQVTYQSMIVVETAVSVSLRIRLKD